jgi:hypothetical protein
MGTPIALQGIAGQAYDKVVRFARSLSLGKEAIVLKEVEIGDKQNFKSICQKGD